MIVNGTAVAPDSAKKCQAQLLLCPDGTLKIQLDDQSGIQSEHQHFFQGDVKQISVSDVLGNIPRTVTFPNGWTFTPISNTQLNEWLKQFQSTSWIHAFERNLAIIAVAILVTVSCGWWVVTSGLPYSSKMLANALPVSINNFIGEQALSTIDENLMEPSELDVAEQARLLELFQSLITTSELRKYTPTLLFRSWSNANAFALADGTVVMTDEMLEIASTDEEIIGILLHELGHVEHNHVMEHVVHATFLSVLISYAIGDIAGIGELLTTVSFIGLQSNYSQKAETEADEYAAIKLLERYGNTDAMVSIFEKLQAESDLELPSWLSSHPDMQKRIQHIKDTIECPSELAKCRGSVEP